jgi:hypothetical protein
MVHCFERFQQSAKVSRQELLPKAGSLRACASSRSVTSSFMALAFEKFAKNPNEKSLSQGYQARHNLTEPGIEVSFGPISAYARRIQ